MKLTGRFNWPLVHPEPGQPRDSTTWVRRDARVAAAKGLY